MITPLLNSLEKDEGFEISNSSIKPSRRRHQTFENVKIVQEQWILVSVSKMGHLQIMDLVSTILMSGGGVIAGLAGLEIKCSFLGVFMITLGLYIHYKQVRKTVNSWINKKGHRIIVIPQTKHQTYNKESALACTRMRMQNDA
jgi:hypothetical protein